MKLKPPKYTIDEIRQRVAPVARQYRLRSVTLFGSYARNEASHRSDVDLLVDDPDNNIPSLLELAGLHNAFGRALQMRVDVITTDALDEKFSNRIAKDEVLLYAQDT